MNWNIYLYTESFNAIPTVPKYSCTLHIPSQIQWEVLTYFITWSAFIKSCKHLCKKSSTSGPAHCRLSNPRVLTYSIQHNKMQHFPPWSSFLPAWYLRASPTVGRELQTSWEVIWLVPWLPPVSCTAVEWSDERNHSQLNFARKRKGVEEANAYFLVWFYFFVALTLSWLSLKQY